MMMMMMSYIYRWGRLLSLGTDAVVLPPQSWHKSNLVLLSSGMFPLFVQCVNVPTWRLFIHIWRCVFFNEDLCGWAHTCNLPVRGCVHVVSLLCGRKSFLENVLQLHGWRNHFTGRNTLQTRLLVRKCWVDSHTHTHIVWGTLVLPQVDTERRVCVRTRLWFQLLVSDMLVPASALQLHLLIISSFKW